MIEKYPKERRKMMKKLFKTLTCALAALLAAVTFAGCQGDPGVNGKTPEFRVENGVFQWKYTTDGEDAWQDIVDIDDLKGEKGDTGATGATGPQGEKGDDGVTPEVAIYENLFDKSNVMLQKTVNTDNGEITDTASDKYALVKYVYNPGQTITWQWLGAINAIYGGPGLKLAFYDAEDNFLGRYSAPSYDAEGNGVTYVQGETYTGVYSTFTMKADGLFLDGGIVSEKVIPAYFYIQFDARKVNEMMIVEGSGLADFPPEYVAFGKTLIVLGDQTLTLEK